MGGHLLRLQSNLLRLILLRRELLLILTGRSIDTNILGKEGLEIMSETSKLHIPEGSDAIFQANLDAAGAYADNLEKGFSKFPEKVIPIDNDIRVVGIKSPIYLIILGFSTLNVLKAIRKLKKQIDYVLIIEPDMGRVHQTFRREYIKECFDSEDIDLLIGIPPGEMGPYLHKIFTRQDKKFGSRCGRCQFPEIVVDPF